ncbi:MAG: flavin reductase family protein [Burkholderiales bacterium]|nr:flavin reductase family protein [Burkholderiales bacterium]
MKHVALDGGHDARHLRDALGRFSTGVAIVTTRAPDGAPEGLTVNSFAALSLDPPLVVWSLNRRSPSLPAFVTSGHFVVNVLRAEQVALSHRFASRQPGKFEGLDSNDGPGGAPVLTGMLATFECTVETSIPGGDHVMFVGRVHRIGYAEGEPLIFHAGRYCTAQALPTALGREDLKEIWGKPG